MRAVLTLILGIAGCALILWLGPAAAETILPLLSVSQQGNAAIVEIIFALIVYGGLLLFALLCTRIQRTRLRLGRTPMGMLAVGGAVGAIGLGAAVLLAKLAGSLQASAAPASSAGLILCGTGLVLFAASAEEVYFRGWIQPAVAASSGMAAAVLLSSACFSTLHILGGARGPLTLLNLFLGGLLFGLLAARGAGLAAPIGAHAVWNWSEQIGLGLDPNPGVGSFGALSSFDLVGRPVWGGSGQGLNGSLAMTISLIALLAPMLILMRRELPISRGLIRPEAAE
jgi:membrane protease YdiL (CAAX protease family)